MDTSVVRVAKLLKEARSVIALTGAGISTPSGIPDFRSHHSGLWEQANPKDVATIFAFKTNPPRFFEWIRPLLATVVQAEPNPAHMALVRLERMGKLKTIITQNIDQLHSKAGSQHVIEVHGSLRQMTCIACYRTYDAAPYIEHLLATGEIPHCPKCSGILKPNVILFGEQLPIREVTAAQQAASQCDVMLVVGSSLEVYPVSDMPLTAHRNGAKIILINYQTTLVDSVSEVVIRDNVATVLPQIADVLEAL